MAEARAGGATWSHFAGLALVYALGFGFGLLGLLYASRLWKPRPRTSIGPGAMAAADVRPSWGWLGLAGLVGGGPTFLGTVVGTRFESAFRTAPSLPPRS